MLKGTKNITILNIFLLLTYVYLFQGISYNLNAINFNYTPLTSSISSISSISSSRGNLSIAVLQNKDPNVTSIDVVANKQIEVKSGYDNLKTTKTKDIGITVTINTRLANTTGVQTLCTLTLANIPLFLEKEGLIDNNLTDMFTVSTDSDGTYIFATTKDFNYSSLNLSQKTALENGQSIKFRFFTADFYDVNIYIKVEAPSA